MVKMKHNRGADNGHDSHVSMGSSVSYPKQMSHVGKGGHIVGKRDGMRSEINLLISVGGIYGCYLLSGLLQEGIYVYRAEDGGKFVYTFFLLWIQCAVNVCLAFIFFKIGECVSMQQALHS